MVNTAHVLVIAGAVRQAGTRKSDFWNAVVAKGSQFGPERVEGWRLWQ